MPSIKISVPHTLTQSEATHRIQNLLQDLRSQLGNRIANVKESWMDHGGEISFDVMGFNISGSVSVQINHVQLTGQIPMAALPLKNKIETTIQERVEALLS